MGFYIGVALTLLVLIVLTYAVARRDGGGPPRRKRDLSEDVYADKNATIYTKQRNSDRFRDTRHGGTP